MPGPLLCGPLTGASLLPKLRDHFAEFLNDASPVGLGILSLSTCVGLRYGYTMNDSGFSRRALRMLPYYFSVHITPSGTLGGFASPGPAVLIRGIPSPRHAPRTRPHISVIVQYRDLNLLSIGYGSRPRLRPRLSQGRSALPWRPWISGPGDSHPCLATHSGILPARLSTAPCGTASSRRPCSPTMHICASQASVACFSPVHLRRGTSRPVSCYALF